MYKTTPSCLLKEIYGELPPDNVPDDVDLDEVSRTALNAIQNLNKEDLAEDVIWRDWLSLSGRARTFCGAEEVFNLWSKCIAHKRIEEVELKNRMPMKPCPGSSWVSVSITFNTVQDNGLTGYHTGILGLVPTASGDWKVWTIVTILETFKGYGHPDEPQIEPSNRKLLRPDGVDYSVAIVGAGQSGLAVAGRLKALDIPAIVIEREPNVGSAWTRRYDSVRQHTPKEFNNLPFDRTWNAEDDDLLPGKVVAEGFERYVDRYGIEVWTSSEAMSCVRDDNSQIWTIDVTTKAADGKTQTRTIKTKHLVAATGVGLSRVRSYDLPGRETFKGTIMHQNQFKNAKEFAGKRAIVIGSGTTGHDIAQDCLDNKMNVTMVQRLKTPIIPIEWLPFKQLWNRDMPTPLSDRLGMSMPHKVNLSIFRRNHEKLANEPHYRNFFDNLDKAGFKVDRETFMSDIFCSSKWGTWYIDVGTSQRIIDGDIKVKSGIPPKSFTEEGVLFEDGDELPADLIVTAIGYEADYRKVVASLVGDEMAGKLPEFWGTTRNGDLRGFMQEARPGFWMFGGGAELARWQSRFVALQIMVDLDGVNNVIY